jgi:multidrug efflux pump subunit AcrA (membrane-fusion protein)
MHVEFVGTISAMQGTGQNQDAQTARLIQQQVQAAQQQAQLEQQQARVEQQQAAQEAAREAQQAQREAQRAIRDAQREIQRAVREGRPGMALPQFPGGSGPQIPEGAVIISVAFFVMCAVIAIGFPIARAIARRMDKRGASTPVSDSDTHARLERIEQAVDAIAVEVERISEGQRFTTKIMGELRALPQPDPAAALGERVASPLRAREAR